MVAAVGRWWWWRWWLGESCVVFSSGRALCARRSTPLSLLPLLLLLRPLLVWEVSRECVRSFILRNGSGVARSRGLTSSASCARGVMNPTASRRRRDDRANRRPKRFSALSVEALDEMVEVGLMPLSKG